MQAGPILGPPVTLWGHLGRFPPKLFGTLEQPNQRKTNAPHLRPSESLAFI